MRRPTTTLLLVALLPIVSRAASGGTAVVVAHTGYLIGANDAPVTDPGVSMVFRILSADTGGTPEWEATCSAVNVAQGYYAVALGASDQGCTGTSADPILDTADVPPTADRWLEVVADGFLLSPRTRLAVLPGAAMAARALDSNQLGGKPATAYYERASGTPNHVLVNDAAGVITSEAQLAAVRGGTGADLSGASGLLRVVSGVFATDTITNADVASNAALARSKLAAGTANTVVVNDATGALASVAQLPIARGGTGAATASAAFNALTPQTTKGDLAGHDGTGSVRLGAGVDGTVLTADASSPAGLKWAAPVIGGGSGGLTWSTITTATTATTNGAYVTNSASLVTITLPSTCLVGDRVRVTGRGTGGWKLVAPGGVTLADLGGLAFSAAGIASQAIRDTVEVTCVTANTEWVVTTGTSPALLRSCAAGKTTFTYTGNVDSLPVGNCSTATVKVWGAGGGGGTSNAAVGGAGGYATGTFALVAGETLSIIVGGGGTGGSPSTAGVGGFGGGGAGNVNGGSYGGGGGGGRSAILRGSTNLVVAGGGGGGGYYTGFGGAGGGGTAGTGGSYSDGGGSAVGGSGATTSGPGAGGTSNYGAGGAGTVTNGGSAGTTSGCTNGGGGGGLYGGGAGGKYCGGGGGGSGLAPSGGTTATGAGATPPSNVDLDYGGGAALGGALSSAGGHGRVVITLSP